MPGQPPQQGALMHTIIVRTLNFRDRDAILQAARSHDDLQLDNTFIRFFLDFTLRVQRQQKNVDAVKKALRAKEVKYAMLFSAKVPGGADGKTWYFTSREEVWDWLEGWRAVSKKHSACGQRNLNDYRGVLIITKGDFNGLQPVFEKANCSVETRSAVEMYVARPGPVSAHLLCDAVITSEHLHHSDPQEITR
ncbi:hypothetical protein NDU88_001555 [Pleurodeles waltl]|uniref:Uncharacterized protein n=1 Tax=Pleurodeles waltl TaxID=8319 RepID=A0AAV7KYX2_PLEWA|nr:hypothetical protein NDU88_001555 [Pleurodeles waltl]